MPFGTVQIVDSFFRLVTSGRWSCGHHFCRRNFSLKNKLEFAILVSICVTVAVTAGPSSANLIIARQGLWPKESTYLAINATIQDIWPDRLDDAQVDQDCAIVGSGSGKTSAHCPLSELYDRLVKNVGESQELSSQTPFTVYETTIPYSVKELSYSSKLLTSHCDIHSKDQLCVSISHAGIVDGFLLNSMV